MKEKFRNYIFRDQVVKLIVNHTYVYLINLVHVVLDLLPWFVRGFCFQLLGMKTGKWVFLDHKVYIKFPWLVKMGDGVSINRGVEFYPDFFGGHGIILGSNIRVAPHVLFLASGHDLRDKTYPHLGEGIIVEDNVWIGARSTILPGVRIGRDSVIGAGSVVTRNVLSQSIVAGVPARRTR